MYIHELARNKAAEIYKSLIKYPNTKISKASIRSKFNIPHTQSYYVWEVLRDHGIDIDRFSVEFIQKEEVQSSDVPSP